MTQPRLAAAAAATTAAVLLGACSGGGDGIDSTSGSGSLSLSLIDAPVTEVDQIWLTITQINVKPAGGSPIEFPLDPVIRTDLITLDVDNAQDLLENEAVPAGQYEWIELEVDADFDSQTDDSWVVTNVGGVEELRVPSGSVRLVSGFTVTADRATRFVIDWDMRRGLVNPPGQAGYLLRPAFRVVDMTEYGTLSGIVETALITSDACDDDGGSYDVGNAVYVFQDPEPDEDAVGASPDDIDGDDADGADPLATIDVDPGPDGPYVYGTILSPGAYTLALTCLAGYDDPQTNDADLSFIATVDVEIVAGAETVHDFHFD